tara:strand:+ start:38369 stop:39742 length:1374 start_codon:yes stop_codon:yes gene_type:complete
VKQKELAVENKYSRYLTQYSEFEEWVANNSSPLDDSLRLEAINEFRRIGFPTAKRGNEAWKFTNVNPIANQDFHFDFKSQDAELNSKMIREVTPYYDQLNTITLVNGIYNRVLSRTLDAGIVIKALRDKYPNCSLGTHAGVKSNGFIAINTAFINDGAEILVSNNYECAAPINIVHISTGNSVPRVTYPRTLIILESNSSASIIESYISINSDSQFTNAVTEIAVGEGAQLNHYRYLHESPSGFHIGSTVVDQKADSSFKTVSYSKGSKVGRNDLLVRLNDAGASCDIRGLYFTEGDEHIDNHINVDHAAPNTYSNQYFKGILADTSRAVFSGKTLIRQIAQKSEALQGDKNLILSEGARVNTKPSLEIYADDIQAAHGATAGAIPDDQIMYMLARGLDMETATSFLIQGFANEIIDSITLKEFKEYLLNYFDISMPKFRFQGFRKGKVYGGPVERV